MDFSTLWPATFDQIIILLFHKVIFGAQLSVLVYPLRTGHHVLHFCEHSDGNGEEAYNVSNYLQTHCEQFTVDIIAKDHTESGCKNTEHNTQHVKPLADPSVNHDETKSGIG